MRATFPGIATLIVLYLFLVEATAWSQTVAIVNGRVHPVNQPVIDSGVVLMEDGRIQAVGAVGSISVPPDALSIDVQGKVVTPGLIDAATAMGLVEVGSLADTRDQALDVDDPVRAAFRARDGLNPHSIIIPITRLGGITTVASLPSGGVISGRSVVLDLDGATAADMIVREDAAMVGGFNPGSAEQAGGSRGGLVMRLKEAFEDARFFGARRDAYERGNLRSLALSRLDLLALQPLLAGEMPLVLRASRASDIDSGLAIAAEYDLSLVVLGGEEAWRRSETLAAQQIPVIVKAYRNLPLQFDRLGSRFDNAALLSEAGVSVVLSTFDTHNARNLRFEAGQAVRHGMDWDTALEAVTLNPASALGIADTHGSLEVGKVANLVVWSGDPFEFSTSPERIWIQGREITPDSRQKRLLERYLELDGDPTQYRAIR